MATTTPDDGVAQSDLDAVMEDVPKGAMALSALAVAALLAGWFYIYFWVFIPRGAVG